MLGRNPALRFIVVSDGYGLAEKFARDCLRIIDAPWFRAAFSALRLIKRSILDFETSQGGGRLSTSLGGAITGRGADFIILDDPLKAEEALNDAARGAANAWLDNTMMYRLNEQGTGSIVLVMQRLHEDDVAGTLIARGGWQELRLPAIAPADEPVQISDTAFYQRREGHALHPARNPLHILKELRAQNAFVFEAQQQQQPVPRIGNFVDPAWFVYYDQPPTGGMVVMSCDTASRPGVHNAYSVAIISRYIQGRHYVLDVFRAKRDFVSLLDDITALCRRHGVQRLLIENAASGIHLLDLFRKKLPQGVPRPIGIRPTADKITRYAAQASRIQAGELVLPRTAPWLGEFVHEILGFPNTRYKDQANALSQLLANPPLAPTSALAGPESCMPDDETWNQPGPYDPDFDPW